MEKTEKRILYPSKKVLEFFHLEKGSRIALTACSNGLSKEKESQIAAVYQTFEKMDLHPVISPCFYERYNVFSGTAKERAKILMDAYQDPDIVGIFDLSGGDLANEILDFLDYEAIAKARKPFWGYSDLTCLLNAIYARTGVSGGLWQAKNLAGPFGACQAEAFASSVFDGKNELFEISAAPIQGVPQGESLEGILVGGNVRCLLKLAGTPYLPDFEGKLLFLESWAGGAARITALFSQMSQMGVFRKIKGLILGTFTEMDEKKEQPDAVQLAVQIVDDPALPIFKTGQVGHGKDSRALPVGETVLLK